MERYRITESHIASINRKRTWVVSIVVFIGVMGYLTWREGAFTYESLAWSVIAVFIAVTGYAKYPLVFTLQEESEWEIAPSKDGLRFHRKNGLSEIQGNEISRIRAKLVRNEPIWIDVHYGEQVTRIRDYEGMSDIYAHLLKISGGRASVEEIR